MRDADADPRAVSRPLELVGTLESINRAERLIKGVIAEVGLWCTSIWFPLYSCALRPEFETDCVLLGWCWRFTLTCCSRIQHSSGCQWWWATWNSSPSWKGLLFISYLLSLCWHAYMFLLLHVFYWCKCLLQWGAKLFTATIGWFNNWKGRRNNQKLADKIWGTHSGSRYCITYDNFGSLFVAKSWKSLFCLQLIQPNGAADQSSEKMVRVTGNKKQIDTAREMIKEVMNQVCVDVSPSFLSYHVDWFIYISPLNDARQKVFPPA